MQVQRQLAETTAVEKEVAHRACVDSLTALLRRMWEDDSVDAARQLVGEGGHISDSDNDEYDDGRGGSGGGEKREEEKGEEWVGGEGGKGTEADDEVDGGTVAAASHRMNAKPSDAQTLLSSSSAQPRPRRDTALWRAYRTASSSSAHPLRTPSTLQGLCDALAGVYTTMRHRHEEHERNADVTRAALRQRDDTIRALETRCRQLQDCLHVEQERETAWKVQLDELTVSNPMRDLLARQESLLQAVTSERNALRGQWSALTADYISLEQRNSELHSRCTEKEHENARLNGLLFKSTGVSPRQEARPVPVSSFSLSATTPINAAATEARSARHSPQPTTRAVLNTSLSPVGGKKSGKEENRDEATRFRYTHTSSSMNTPTAAAAAAAWSVPAEAHWPYRASPGGGGGAHPHTAGCSTSFAAVVRNEHAAAVEERSEKEEEGDRAQQPGRTPVGLQATPTRWRAGTASTTAPVMHHDRGDGVSMSPASLQLMLAYMSERDSSGAVTQQQQKQAR